MACVARPHCDAKAAKELYESEACIALLVSASSLSRKHTSRVAEWTERRCLRTDQRIVE